MIQLFSKHLFLIMLCRRTVFIILFRELLRFSFVALCLVVLSCENNNETDDSLIPVQLQVIESTIKEPQIKEYHCCFEWEGIKINGKTIIGEDYRDFLSVLQNYTYEKGLFSAGCGVLSSVHVHPEALELFDFGFLKVGLFSEDGTEKYFACHIDVPKLLDSKIELMISGVRFNEFYQPSVFEIIDIWQLELKNYKLDELIITNGHNEYGIQFTFDDYQVLKYISYWSSC